MNKIVINTNVNLCCTCTTTFNINSMTSKSSIYFIVMNKKSINMTNWINWSPPIYRFIIVYFIVSYDRIFEFPSHWCIRICYKTWALVIWMSIINISKMIIHYSCFNVTRKWKKLNTNCQVRIIAINRISQISEYTILDHYNLIVSSIKTWNLKKMEQYRVAILVNNWIKRNPIKFQVLTHNHKTKRYINITYNIRFRFIISLDWRYPHTFSILTSISCICSLMSTNKCYILCDYNSVFVASPSIAIWKVNCVFTFF